MVVPRQGHRDWFGNHLFDLADGTGADTRTHAILEERRLGRRGRHRMRARRRSALCTRRASGAHGRGRSRYSLLAGRPRSAGVVVGAGAGGGTIGRAVHYLYGNNPLLAVRLVASFGSLDDEEPVRGDGALDGLRLHVLGQGALARELAGDDSELVGAFAMFAVDHNLVINGLYLEVITVEVANIESETEAFGVVSERCPDGRLQGTAIEQPASDVVVPVLVAPVLAVQPRVLVVKPTTKVIQFVRQPAACEQRGHGLFVCSPPLNPCRREVFRSKKAHTLSFLAKQTTLCERSRRGRQNWQPSVAQTLGRHKSQWSQRKSR